MSCSNARLLCPWNFPSKNTGAGCHFLLKGIILTQGWNPGLLSWQTVVFCLFVCLFYHWSTREVQAKDQNQLMKQCLYEIWHTTFPVVQGLWICLSMQRTQVRSLVQEDPTCLATKLMHRNYWSPQALELVLHNMRSHCNEKPMYCKKSSPTCHN